MTQIILATKSPYRKKFFEELELDFVCEGSDINENFENRPKDPRELVKHLAKLKAEAVAKRHSSGIVIGFDSLGFFNGEILEKPKSRQDAFDRLKKLSGKMHEFYTGIHMINIDNGKVLSDVVESKAWFRELKDYEIEKYLKQDPHFIKYAAGFDPPHKYSATFIKRIEGSYNNLLSGLPVERIIPMLFEIGYKLK